MPVGPGGDTFVDRPLSLVRPNSNLVILHISGVISQLVCFARIEPAKEQGIFVFFSGLTWKGVLQSTKSLSVRQNP